MNKKDVVSVVASKPDMAVMSVDQAIEAITGMNSEWKLTRVERDVLEKAVICQQKHYDAAISYWELCVSIRKSKLDTGTSRLILLGAGFPKSRISEIHTVCMSTQDIFNQYAERFIGFKAALEKARGAKGPGQFLMDLPQEMEPTAHSMIEKVLGDRKKAVIEIDGVKIIFSRTKPAEKTDNKAGQPAQPVKKGKNSK